jgi:predicted metalloprotease
VVIVILGLIFGQDFIGGGGDPGYEESAPGQVAVDETPREREMALFVGFVLDSTQAMWAEKLPGYRDAKLVLFRDMTPTGCGVGQSAMGPFYCPTDEKVYIDLGFYDVLQQRFGADGDFAQAYVIAHEVGHHVQHLLGTDRSVRDAQQSDPRNANALSVVLELQADGYAGVWAHDAERAGLLSPGDLEEGLNAAAAVGDDRIQQREGGRVNQETFTHGSAQQRALWFRRGYAAGDPRACDPSRTR